ncbi:MAG: DNA translocase FtsK 4TM domain-containing protein [Candidatus Geothermincolales bacterium]
MAARKGKPRRKDKPKASKDRKREKDPKGRTSRLKERAPAKGTAQKASGPGNLREIISVVLAALVILLVLALYFRSLGPVGKATDKALSYLFGLFRYLIPPLLVAIIPIVLTWKPEGKGEGKGFSGLNILGLAMISVSLCGLLQIRGTPLEGTWTTSGLIEGGGVIGATVSWPFRAGMGDVGALVVLSASLLVGILLLTGLRFPLRSRTGFRQRSQEPEREERERELEVKAQEPSREKERDKEEAGTSKRTAVARVAERERVSPGEEEPVSYRVEKDGQISIEIPEIFGGRVYRLPPLELLSRHPSGDERPRKGMEKAIAALEKTLEEFGVEASIVQVTMGPTVTRFELELGSGVKVNRLLNLAGDISLALGSPDIRMITPIPGKSAVGIEVPNRERELVTLGEVLASPQARNISSPLKVGLGKDVAGYPVVVDLRDMPHLLMAGATGTGKSSCINSMITSILMHAAPHEVRMLLIDPKYVELNHFNGLPHLLAPVINDPKKAAQALGWVVKEMERRYQVLARAGVKNISAYSQALREGLGEEKDEDGKPAFPPMPYILVFIDELADLMMVAPSDVEESIVRIAQMARAVGIHLVVATQRPSVDVVTGIIKANMPSRIAFTVASQADSRVILDQGGAEKLVGKGDMLFLPAGESRPHRIQGSYITEAEITRVTAFIKRQTSPAYEEEIVEEALQEKTSEEREDELLEEALETVVRCGMASASLLQRKLRIGYARAARLIDMLEDMGVVGAHEGSKPRAVLMTPEELEERKRRLARGEETAKPRQDDPRA